MKQLLAALTAMALAAAVSTLPAMSKDKGGGGGNGSGGSAGNSAGGGNGNGGGKGSGQGASASAPGQSKGDNKGARASASGRSEAAVAPRAGNGSAGLRGVLSSIRAGSSPLAGVGQNATVNLVNVDDLVSRGSRSALNKALRDNRGKIQNLRADLRH